MNKFYRQNKSLLRASFAAGSVNEPRLENVDREGKVLNGVQITLEGEALGHDVWLDRQFCQDVVNAGNKAGEAGVKVRFGHPSMCSDAIGTYLGRAKSFRLVDLTRKDGTPAAGVLADIYLDPNADRTEWVLNMAESAPDTFGQSIVFTYADTKYVDADGVWHMMSEEGANFDASADGREYAVLGVLHGTDFTDTPAATDGVFSADSLAAEAENIIAEHPQLAKVPAKNVIEFFKRAGLTNVLDAFENNRISKLQKHEAEALAAKDEEIVKLKEAVVNEQKCAVALLAELEAKASEKLAKKDDEISMIRNLLSSAEEELTEQASEIETFKSKLTDVENGLSAAKAALDAEITMHHATKDALAEKSAALEVAEARYADQVGKALTLSASKDAWASKYREVCSSKKCGNKSK